MKNYWRRFAAWATGSRDDLFRSARFRLTALYLFITAATLIVFSLVLYVSLSRILTASFGDDGPDPHDKGDQLILRTIHDLKINTIALDVIALFAASGLSYLLAGKTLIPIRKTLDAQKEFSANASHELRTPLAIMKTECEVALRNHQLDAGAKKIISSNLEEVERMSYLTENLLKLSRIESGKKDAFSHRINIADVVADISGKMRLMAEQKNVGLELVRLDPSTILGNRGYLESMLINIMQNSINYNRPGGAVRISLVNNGKTAKIIVEDTGRGISKEDLSHVFERFYKSDKSHGYSSGGAGIGLSIVKEIIEKHDGSIEIESTIGVGTKAIVELPIV